MYVVMLLHTALSWQPSVHHMQYTVNHIGRSHRATSLESVQYDMHRHAPVGDAPLDTSAFSLSEVGALRIALVCYRSAHLLPGLST